MVQVHRPKVKFFDTKQDLLASISTELFSLINSFSEEFGVVRVGFSFNKELDSLYRNISQDVTFDWDRVELFQLEEKLTSCDTLKKNFSSVVSQEFLESLKEVNYLDNFKNKQDAVDQCKSKLGLIDGGVFDLVVIKVDENGSFSGIYTGSEISHSKEPIALGVDMRDNINYLTYNGEIIASAKYILAITDTMDVADEILAGRSSVQDFPAKLLCLNKNFVLFTLDKQV